MSLTCSLHCRAEERKRNIVPEVARLPSESNRGNAESHAIAAPPDLSALTGKPIKRCDDASGESNKRFILTLNYLLTTNRAATAGEGPLPGSHTRIAVWMFFTFGSTFHGSGPSTSQSLPHAEWIRFQDPGLSWDWPSPGNRGLSGGRSQVLIYKMAIFFFHNSMLLHYQILSGGQYLIPEVLDVNERCFASGHWGLNQQV